MIFFDNCCSHLGEKQSLSIFRQLGRFFRPPTLLRILLLFIFLFVSTVAHAVQVTLNLKSVPLEAAFAEIKKQTGYGFWYEKKDLVDLSRVTIDVKNADLVKVLEVCMKGQPLTYQVFDKTVVVKRKVVSSPVVPPAKKSLQEKVRGKVVDAQTKEPLAGVLVKVKSPAISVVTNDKGEFELNLPNGKYELFVQYLGYGHQGRGFTVPSAEELSFILTATENTLNEVQVVNTGYQKINMEKATGSYVAVDSALFNRRVGSSLLDRLDGVVSGMLFNKNTGSTVTTNAAPISIRGRSTIFANPNPLVVVDNFPFNGNINSINPNDIESVTVLKDAAAAAIWGAFSGNGVIVVTTKKGSFNRGPNIAVNSSIALGERPDLGYSPRLSSKNAVELEELLFNRGYYNSRINSAARQVLSPVVELLLQRRNGQVSKADSAARMDLFKQTDTRDGLGQFFYRGSMEQRYNLSISGGSATSTYYIAGGFDRNLDEIERNGSNRLNLTINNTHQFRNRRIVLDYTIGVADNRTKGNGMSTGGTPYPYISFTDGDGNSAALPMNFRKSYIDTLGRGKLLDWRYRPLDELGLNDNATNLREYRVNGKLSYRILEGLQLSAQYQWNVSNSKNDLYYRRESFYARNYINQYTEYIQSSDNYRSRLPMGGILDWTDMDYQSDNVRLQLAYERGFAGGHSINFVAGYEQRWVENWRRTGRLYGYNGESGTASFDYATNFLLIPNGALAQIANNVSQQGNSGRFRSMFASATYDLSGKYQASASLRKDQSNIFGVSTNQKGVPLWSLGAGWIISKEKFFQLDWLPYLKLRATNGYQGNTDPSLSSLVTSTINPLTVNYYNLPYSTLSNPPNEELRWEKVNTINLGLDFRLLGFLSGNVDYYVKRAKDLIGITNVDPTSGVSTFKGNVAGMRGTGVDISLTSENLKSVIKWQTTLLWSYAKDRVSDYTYQPTTLSSAITAGIGPIKGYPVYAIYALPWAGLDANGDPQVYFNGQTSKNYSQVNNSTDLANLKYMGPRNPPVFGSIRNDLQWKSLTLSINITYKFGHYFRNRSISYGDLFGGVFYQPDGAYNRRWQKTGDEGITDIPAMVYPANNARDVFYRNTSIHIEKGDLIRLQDLHVGYTLKKSKRWPFAGTTIYTYLNNLGLIWRANSLGIDPDLVPTGALMYPNPRTYALGLKLTL